MNDNKPSKAPLIIFGSMMAMSIITVAIVFITHSQRTEPYLQSRARRMRPKVVDPHVLSLNYQDFGPQAMAHSLLGNQWWQWQSTGGDDPNQHFDIKVIVYRDISKAKLRKRFPVSKAKRIDSRYLDYDKALDYLEAQIEENTQPKTTVTLEKTRIQILDHFAL